MTHSSTVFLRGVIVLIALATLAAMVRFPLTEGRAANLDLVSIYFDFFILYGYAASIPFFVALYQAFRLLGYVGQNKVFSPGSVKALKTIKYCAIAVGGFIVVGEILLMVNHDGKDDITGAVSMGIIMTFLSIVTATAAAVFERTLQSAVDLKSENELTV